MEKRTQGYHYDQKGRVTLTWEETAKSDERVSCWLSRLNLLLIDRGDVWGYTARYLDPNDNWKQASSGNNNNFVHLRRAKMACVQDAIELIEILRPKYYIEDWVMDALLAYELEPPSATIERRL